MYACRRGDGPRRCPDRRGGGLVVPLLVGLLLSAPAATRAAPADGADPLLAQAAALEAEAARDAATPRALVPLSALASLEDDLPERVGGTTACSGVR